MKKLLFIGTGGTIASETESGALSPRLDARQLLSSVPGIADICHVDAVQLFTLDSTNMTPAHWLMIAREIRRSYGDYDGFVIAHGTDTMAYTASALSYLLQGCRKSVILTGAQRPIGFDTTDSRQNLSDSFLCAASGLFSGVLVVFGGQVLLGTRARKVRTKSFYAFSSVNYPPVATVLNGRITRYFAPPQGPERFYDRLDASVGLLKLTPGLDSEVLGFMLSRYNALVIEAFGVGGLPDYDSGFRREIAAATAAGKPVVLTTQVPSEGTDMSVYTVGSSLSSLGVMESLDMTSEACLTKLMWLLPLTEDLEERRRLFFTPVDNDILPPQSPA